MMIHELTHASQVRRLEIEKGTRWVAEYWSINAKKQLNNTIFKGGDPYGNKGDNHWEQTALSEGWGYFMERTMAKFLLNWNSLSDETFKKFPYRYAGMYDELYNIGCNYNNLERCLGVYSLQEYKNNLLNYYPQLSNQITQIVTKYENVTFN